MKRIIFISISIILIAVSCVDVKETNKKKQLVEKIENYEKQVTSPDSLENMKQRIDSLIQCYQQFINKYEDDSLTVYYKYKKAGLLLESGRFKGALKVYTDVYENYPDFEKRPEALFYMAVINGDYLKNYPVAEIRYREFIKNYPENELVDDAKMLIKFLGKSDEEILEIITKSKQDTTVKE